MSITDTTTGHHEPGVMKILGTEEAEKVLERVRSLKEADEESRQAVADHYAFAAQEATVIDAEGRAKAVADANDCDAAYRQTVAEYVQAQERRNKTRAEVGESKEQLSHFRAATHQDQDTEPEVDADGAPRADHSVGGWMPAISRSHVTLPFTGYVGILVASVALGFLLDKGSFNALQLAQKTLGFSTTDGLAFAIAVLVPALGHLAGLMVWWLLDPDTDAGRKRRPSILLVPAVVAAACLVMAIVTLRVDYLHHTGVSISIWPLIGISLAVLFVDLCASALRHNPWPAKLTELEDEVDDKEQADDEADVSLVTAEKNVMGAQGKLAKAVEKLLDPHFVHFTDKAPLIATLRERQDAEKLTSQALIYPPQDAARLKWIMEYNASCPSPFAPKVIEGALIPHIADKAVEETEAPPATGAGNADAQAGNLRVAK